MGNLVLALAAFLGTHFALSHPLRAPLVAKIGTAAFQLLYTIIAFVTLGWVYFAFIAAPRGPDAWPVGETLWIVATVLMLIASVMLAGSFIGNPALPAPGAKKLTEQRVRGVFAITRHPMMWSFALWALVHALIAPYPASFALTGAMGFLALAGSAGQDRKKKVLMGDAWADWSARTSFVPFGGQFAGRIPWSAAWPGRTALLGGVVIWLLATYLHTPLGSRVVGPWNWMG